MLICKICHGTIEEYVLIISRRPTVRIARKYECPLHGPLHYQTMEPLELDRMPLKVENELKREEVNL